MGISFAGQPLLLQDPDGRIDNWFTRWLEIPDSRMVCEWPTPGGCFSGTSVYYTGQPLPAPNWSKPLTPKLSTWYVPTGASRWSFGLFLCDYEHLYGGTANVSTSQSILGRIGNGNAAQTLTISSPVGGKPYQRSWGQCYLLPPHPVSTEAFSRNGLWLLPIVDERYYWQFITGFESPIDNTSPTSQTWAALFASIAAGMGIDLTVDAIPTTYLYPNPFVISGTSPHSGPQLLDAAAYSVGQRIVPDYGAFGPKTDFPGGRWLSQNWANAKTRRGNNLSVAYDIGALQYGNVASFPNEAAIAPESVVVGFRASKNGIVVHDWKTERYQKSVTAAEGAYTGGTTNGYSATVLSTALADISLSDNIDAPDNQAALNNLATQIATDFYAGIWIQDSAINGISQWQESGFDDYVEFNCGERLEDGTYVSKTRIHSTPYNEVMDAMLHYDPSTWEYGDKIYGTLDADLAANGTALMTLTGTDSAKPTGTVHLKVTEVLGATALSGSKVEAIRMGDKWVLVAGVDSAGSGYPSGGSQLILGSCATTVTHGNTGLFTITGGSTLTAGVWRGVALKTKTYEISKATDGNYYVVNPDTLIYGKLNSASAPIKGSSAPSTPAQSALFDVWAGTPGSESADGAVIAAQVRNGWCVDGKLYILDCGIEAGNSAGTAFGFDVLNVDKTIQVIRNTAGTTVAPASPTVIAYTGTPGSETTTSFAITAFLRNGLIVNRSSGTRLYLCQWTENGPEIVDPQLAIDGVVITANILTATTGSVDTYVENTVGDSTAVGTAQTAYNRYSTTINVGVKVRIEWNKDSKAWVITVKYV